MKNSSPKQVQYPSRTLRGLTTLGVVYIVLAVSPTVMKAQNGPAQPIGKSEKPNSETAMENMEGFGNGARSDREAQLRRAAELNNMALRLYGEGRVTEMIQPAVEALRIRKEALGVNHLDYAMSLVVLATLYTSTGDYARAEPLFVEVLAIRKKVLGAKHPDYALSLNDLAILYYRMIGDPARAEPLFVEARVIRKEVLGIKHPDYATTLNSLASLYESIGDLARAEPLFLEAREIRKEVLGIKHPDYATTLSGLAGLYQKMGDFSRAEPLHAEAIAIHKDTLGPKHPGYATTMSKLAGLYQNMGNYSRAEPFYVEAAAIYKDTLGPKHPGYAISLNNLAQLYSNMGDYARAEPLYVDAIKIQKEVLGPKHSEYATSLGNLAELYRRMGDYARAERPTIEALAIYKDTLGPKHPGYAISLNNLAQLYSNMSDYTRAEPLFVEAIRILKEALGPKNLVYATSVSNLAGLYYHLGDHQQAEALGVEILAIQKANLGVKHPSYAQSLSNLASLYETMGKPAKGEPLYRQALSISRSSLEATSSIQSERQQLSMGQSLRHQLDGYVSLGANTGKYGRNVFAQVLVWKGATLVRQRGMRLAADDPAAKELFTRLQRTATQLASLSRAVPGKEDQQAAWRTQVSDLTHAKERLEAELSAKSAVFRQATKEIALDDLLAALPKDAVLVDYLEFNRSTPPKAKGEKSASERQLAAFVVRHAERPEDQVTLIPLGSAAPISAAIDAWRTTFGMDAAGAAVGKLLREAVWQPLLEHLAGAQTVLVSTDGVLGRLPLGALPGKELGTYLLEDHRLAVIPVPQLLPTLVNAEGKRTLSKELLLLGDVDYDAAPGAEVAPKKKQPRRPGETRSPTDARLFEPLAGASGEIAAVKDLYGRLFEVKSDDPRALVQAQADEARFRLLAPQYRHLHLATHGFFAENRFQSSESSSAAALAAQRKLFAPTAQAADAPPAAPIVGIGAQLQTLDGKLLVQAIVADGAAAADGRLKPGDEIRKVGPSEGELVDVAGKPLNDAVALIRGSAGTKVRVEVLPKDGKEMLVYELTRKVIPQAGVAATRTTSASSTSQSSASSPIDVVGYNPGLLSGLALTGANLEPSSRDDDGILTAQEIGVLDLSGVDTVVLSACDTGLGETAGGEGLLGVQRAFQTAGARTTVASLWKVDDLVTRFLMERFYRNLWEKDMSRLDALREAQLYVLKHPEEIRGGDALSNQDKAQARTSPRYWAAFALSGDWR